jgi:ADP-heptose:LPS heptosyltransferase
MAALLAHARVTLTNDTGTSHLAAAVGARSVVVFSGSDPRRWAPLDRRRHRALGDVESEDGAMGRDRCLRDGCRRVADPALMDVPVAQVVAECDALLSPDPSPRAG